MPHLLQSPERLRGDPALHIHGDLGTRPVEVGVGIQAQAGCLDRLLDSHPEVEEIQEDLELGLADRLPAGGAQSEVETAVAHDDDRRVVEDRNLPAARIVHIAGVG